MKIFFFIVTLIMTMHTDHLLLFNFQKDSDLSSWLIVNDGVMGGISQSDLTITEEGHGRFHGKISLENNGGFASVRCRMETKDITGYTKCKIRLKGDGKSYQFRVRENKSDRYTYIKTFDTTGEWEELIFELRDLIPSFRGRKLDIPHYTATTLSEIALLIGNKKQENFTLDIDWLRLE